MGQDHRSDAEGRKEAGRKGLDVDDPVRCIQIMKARRKMWIIISQVIVLDNIDIIEFC